MKKIYTIVLLLAICCTKAAFAQDVFLMNSDPVTTCSGIFYDLGGPGGNYPNNQFVTKTFTSIGNQRLRFNFQQFNTEQCCDWLQIWDGPDVNSTYLGQWQGTNGPGIITSTGNSLTFRFGSDNSVNNAGWAATIECAGPVLTEYNMGSGTINTCSGVFFDSGGRNGSYGSNENRIQTFCSNNGQKIRFDFVQTNVFLGANDTLFAYDGNSTNASLLGAYVAGSRIETIISRGTCITFRFKSDAANTNSGGWSAVISCTTEDAPANNTYLMTSGIRGVCSGVFTDIGGLNGNYENNLFQTQTFQSLNGERLRFTFQQFSTEQCCDWLQIWDGPNDQATFLGQWQGGSSPGVITSTGTSLTFRFRSDNSGIDGGWAAAIECFGQALPEYNMSSGTINTCSGVFFDAGGRLGNYSSNENRTQTFCSNNGQRIRFDFVQNNVFLGQNDTLFAYDGNSVNAPLLGAYVSGSKIETLISTGTCITFRFKSDAANTNGAGWHANISCTTEDAPANNTYLMSSGIRGVCSGVFTDDGGLNGNYSNNLFQTQTFKSLNGQRLRFTFTQFSTEQCCDWMQIWDGPNDQATFLGQWQGGSSPGVITSTGNSLTFRFRSDNSGIAAGWAASIECFGQALPEFNMSNGTTNVCSGVFFDSGGRLGQYQANENRTQTFCSYNGQRIRFDFVNANVFIGEGDTLYAFDGNSVNSPLLGAYVSGSIIEPLVSSGTCITFRFKSNLIENDRGWQALISCTPNAPTPNIYRMSSGIRGVCSGTFTDDGGTGGNYSNNLFQTQTFQSLNGERLRFTFSQFSTEQCCDWMQIWDGPNTNAPFLGEWKGGSSPGVVTSTGNSLTFRFRSDNSTTAAGWNANITCFGQALTEYNMSSGTVNACSGAFYDSGGKLANYGTFENRVQTFCSDNGQKIKFEFNNNAIGLQNGDTLFIYDGNSVNSTLKSILINGSFFETIYSSGTCFTFRFKSTNNNTAQGWASVFSCVSDAELTVYPMSNGLRVACEGIFTDEGGLNGNYLNNSNRTQTFRSPNGERLRFVFNSFRTEGSNFDRLEVYDGPNTNWPLLTTLSGTIGAGLTVTSTGNFLTFRFISNSSTTFEGWSAYIQCAGPALPTYNMSAGTVNTCEGVFYDHAGGGAPYTGNENRVQTFCSNNSQRIVFDFTNFNLGSGDTLWAFDGSNINARLIGIYVANSNVEKITSSGTCITFRFKSDLQNNTDGWKALISCSPEPPDQIVYAMSTGVRVACSGIFADQGGLNGNYFNSQSQVQTFRSESGQRIRFNFQQFALENGVDFLRIYDGASTNAPLIGSFTGTISPGVIVSTGSQLTFWFTSNASGTAAGWAAAIDCFDQALTVYNMSSGTVNTCSGAFYDNGGAEANYPINENRIQTFCATDNNSKIQFNFNPNATRIAANDTLFVYDGNSVSAPLLGYYINQSTIEVLTGSGTCLTFRFKSDLNTATVDQGWAGKISCVSEVPQNIVYAMSTGLRVVCSGIFADQGGLNGNYSNGSNLVQTYQSKNGERLRFDFSQFATENGVDVLRIYDGPNINFPLIGAYSGTNSPGVILSSGTTLTFQFTSNNSGTGAGWAASITCAGPALTDFLISNTPINACEGRWFDDGYIGNYQTSRNYTQTICAPAGNRLVFDFNLTTMAFANGDSLFVYDGSSVSSPLLAILTGFGVAENIISSGNCLTFRFRSLATPNAGWAAKFYCTDNPPLPEIFPMRSGVRVACNGVFTDDGGLNGNYSAVFNKRITYYSGVPGSRLQFNFQQFATENNGDRLWIYDGPSNAAPLIGNFTGTNSPGIVTSTGNSLTFEFVTNSNSTTGAGWRANIACVSDVPLVGTLTESPYCAGGGINIPFTSPNQNQGNTFTAQLSNANGDFTNPITIGTFNSTTGGIINGNLPSGLTASANYRIRILASNPATSGSPSAPFTIFALPAQPSVISGQTSVCPGATLVSYSVANQSGITGFNWTVPPGSTIVAGQGTNSILVNIGSNSGQVSVTAVNSCGNSTPRTLNVNVQPGGAPTATITSNAQNNVVCQGGSITFNSTVQAGTNPQYQWFVNGVEFTGATGPSLTISNNFAGATIRLRVRATSGCFNPVEVFSNEISYTVTPTQEVSVVITNSVNGAGICQGQSVTFNANVTNGGNNPSYSWRINGQPFSGNAGSSFTSSSLSNGDEVSLVLTSSAVCAAPNPAISNVITMVVNPVVVPSISVSSNTGSNQTCAGNPITLSANANGGGSDPTFQWLLNGNPIPGATLPFYTTEENLTGTNNFSVQMTSSAICATPATVTSANFAVTVVSTVAPSVSLSSNVPTGPICTGTPITFTANPVNGGPSPSYVWRVNGNIVSGQTGASYTTSTLPNNAQVTVQLNSSDPCASPTSATSQPITVSFVNSITPAVSITSNIPGNSICQGQNITFTASPTNGGSNPQYQWTVNGVDVAGQIFPTFTTGTLTNNAQVRVRMTSSFTCANPASITSSPITVTVNAASVPTASISSNQGNTLCQGSSMTLTANITNGGNNPQYQWFLNGSQINGATGATYTTPATLSGIANYTVQLTSNASCANPATVTSQPFTITVNPAVIPAVSINSSIPGNTICAGQSISFTATATNGGNNPQYQWLVNGNEVSGQTGSTFTTSTLTNGQTVSVRLTSNANCANPTVVTSAPITITVTPSSPAAVSVSSNAPNNTICAGQSVTFTANPVNGGTNPTYVWRVNGQVQAGQTSSTFTTSSLANNDQVSVEMTSNSPCANPSIATSAPIQIIVTPSFAPAVSLSNQPAGNEFCVGSNIVVTAAPVNGGDAPVYQWTVNGQVLQGQTGASIPLTIFTNTTISVIMTSSLTCAIPQQVSSTPLVINATPPPTVIAQNDISICAGSPATQLTATPAGGTWSGTNVSSGGLFTPAAPGLYTALYQYTIPGTTCSNSDSVKISVLALPQINIYPVAPICVNAAPLQLSASPSGGTWSGNGVSTTGLFNPANSGTGLRTLTYTVTQNGCQNSGSIVIEVVPPVTVDVGGNETVCASTLQVQLSGLPIGGTWSGQGVSSNGLFNPGLVVPGSTVTLTYTVNANGCSSSANKQITVLDPFSTVNISAGPNLNVCINDAPFVLTGMVGSGGTWTGAGVSANGVFNPAAAGIGTVTLTYSVTFLQSPTCVGTATRTITVAPAPSAPTTIGDTVCGSGTATLTAQGAQNYNWYTVPSGGVAIPGANTGIFVTPVLQTTTNYYVSAVTGSCESNRTIATAFVNTFNNPVFSLVGGTLVASPGNANAYQWLLNGQPIAGATASTYVPVASGDYSVAVTVNGCTVNAPVQFILITATGPILVQDNTLVWPNPAKTELNVAGLRISHLQLYDVAGKEIKTWQVNMAQPLHTLTLPLLPKGVYWLRIVQGNKLKYEKIAIER
jgi:hypothetical protein